jgi:hypothetical protein
VEFKFSFFSDVVDVVVVIVVVIVGKPAILCLSA